MYPTKSSEQKEEKLMYLDPMKQEGFRPTISDLPGENAPVKRTNPLVALVKAAPVPCGCFLLTVASFIGASKQMGKNSHKFHVWLNMRIFFQYCTLGSLLLTVHLKQKREENERARKELDSLLALKDS